MKNAITTSFLVLFTLGISTQNVAFTQSPPINDEPCGAIALSCGDENVSGDFEHSTNYIFDDCAYEPGGDVWYTFEADGVSNYTLRTHIFSTGSTFIIQLFRANGCTDELTEAEGCIVANSYYPPEYFSAVYPAGTYFVRLASFGSTSNGYSFDFACNPVPGNSELCTAAPISCGETLIGTTAGAPKRNYPACGPSNDSPGVWYRFDSNISGLVDFSLCNQADFNTRLGIFESDSCTGAMQCIAGNNNYNEGVEQCGKTSLVRKVPVVVGRSYFVLVHGKGFDTGNFALSVQACDDQVSGCTDPMATNFNPSATIDDGSCTSPLEITCGAFMTENFCYGNQEDTLFVYASEAGEPVTLIFDAAVFVNEAGGFGQPDGLRVYDGFNTDGVLLFDYDDILFEDEPSPNLAGFTFSGLSGGITIELHSNGNGSCQNGNVPSATWRVGCGDIDVPGCTDPEAVNYVPTANIDNGSCFYPPSNDEACTALALVCNAEPLVGTLNGATLSGEVANDACEDITDPSSGDVWFSFETSGTSFYKVWLYYGPHITKLFKKGNGCGNLTQISSCQSYPNFYEGYFEQGTYYLSVRPLNEYILTDSYYIYMTCVDPPVNDEPCGAIAMECNGPEVLQNSAGATPTISDECPGNATGDTWYTFEADGTSFYEISEISPGTDKVVSLYKADNCDGELQQVVACRTYPELVSGIFEAGTYYFRIRKENINLSGADIDKVKLTCTTDIPENDEACNATELICNGPAASGTLYGATLSEDPILGYDCSEIPINDVWFTFEADGVSEYSIQRLATSFQGIIVYKSEDCNSAMTTVVSCSDSFDDILVLPGLESGNYLVRYLGSTQPSSNYSLKLLCSLPPCADPYPAVSGMAVTYLPGGDLLWHWDAIPGSIGCQHKLKLTSDGSVIAQYTQLDPGASELPVPGFYLEGNTEYKWKIRCGCSQNPLVAGPWSDLKFTTPPGPGINSNPNPTSETSHVTFNVMRPEKAVLEVYDLNGRRIDVVYSGETEPDLDYLFDYDASYLPQGVYVYRLTTESATVISKFIVAR